jgi:8-oxo-dGTP diphosphatase
MNGRPEICVGAVTLRAEHILLIKRGTDPGRGRWSLPGGRVEFGETMSEALTREVREEAGIEVVCNQIVGWVERMSDQYHFVIVDFFTTPMGTADPVAGSDADDARWVPLWEVTELDLVDGLLDFLAEHEIVRAL